MQKYLSRRKCATGSLLAPVTPMAWKNSTAGFCLFPNVSNNILHPPKLSDYFSGYPPQSFSGSCHTGFLLRFHHKISRKITAEHACAGYQNFHDPISLFDFFFKIQLVQANCAAFEKPPLSSFRFFIALSLFFNILYHKKIFFQ